MSDVTAGTIFNPQFFMNPPWWLGRVESKETWSDNIQGETFTNISGIQGWGHRYKVRIFNWHTGELEKLQPQEMAFCQVIMPVTAGSGHGSATQTPSIESGSVVFGFFMDGMAGQEGYIIGVLGNSNNNVPRERGGISPNQTATSITQTPTGARPTQSLPATPATGPGSLANIPVPPNVDQLSTEQLIKLLDPSKTPSSSVFRAASEARQKARALNLPPAEVERQVLIATVKASREPGASAGSSGNCNLGYQQFSDTHNNDGDNMRSTRIPEDRIVGKTPLFITEAQHIDTQAKIEQDKDSKKKVPLSDVCKKNNSETKGVQRVLKNLLNSIEELKKKYNQVSAFATKNQEFINQVQEKVFYAIEEMSSFIKDIIQGVRGYILKTLSDQVQRISARLFPSENIELDNVNEKALTTINCLFNRITTGSKSILANILSNLLDNLINAPLCAAENLLSNFLDRILGPITSTMQNIFNAFNSLVSSGLSLLNNVTGNLFNALEFIQGIIKFFKCDESQDCVEYNEISQDRSALPGGEPTTSTSITKNPTGKGAKTSQPVSANIVSEETLNSLDPNVPTLAALANLGVI